MKKEIELKPERRLKMYLIAKVWEEHQPWNEEVCSFLHEQIDIFMPHRFNPYELSPDEIPLAVYRQDLEEIMSSDFGLILPPYGNDCSYEVGVYTGMGKPVIAFTRNETEWFKDWMVKGGITCVVTDNPEMYDMLLKDPMLGKSRVEIINSLEQLSEIVNDVVSSYAR